MKTGYSASVSLILTSIDKEIATLQQARNLLAEGETETKQPKARLEAKPKKKKRNLTPEGRLRIAEAVKRRWAKQKARAGK